MRRVALLAGLLLASPAAADMFQDASNAKEPQAQNNLGANPTAHTFYANAYGNCTWDVAGDVGPCINQAIAAAPAGSTALGGGGKVILPAGEFGLSTTIAVLAAKGVSIEGAGGAGDFGICGTTLNWTGVAAGTMATFGNDTNTGNVVGAGLADLCLDGKGVAGAGVKLRSVNRSYFARTSVRDVTSRAWDMDVGAAAPQGVSGNVFSQNNIFLLAAAAINADGWFIGAGKPASNTHHNTWYTTNVQHQNGRGFVVGSADSNVVYGYTGQAVSSGTGKSLEFLGANSPLFGAYQNRFIFAEPQGGTIARGVGLVNPSERNDVEINRASGAPTPEVELGASLNIKLTGEFSSEPKLVRVNTFGGQLAVTRAEMGAWETNTTAVADQAARLPKAVPGMHYCFQADGFLYVVWPDLADTIRRGAVTLAAGAQYQISPGGVACVVAYAPGKWQMYGDAAVVKATVAQLPTCNSFAEGRLYGVSDANSAVFNAAVAAGGANRVMAYCDGTGWKVH